MRHVALLALILLPACASFESGALPHLDRWPPAAAAAADAERTLRVEFVGLPDKFVDGWQRETVAALAASGRFARVTGAEGAASDRVLRYEIQHSRPGGIWRTRILMGACAATAGIFPAPAPHEFVIDAVVLDGQGQRLGSVRRTVGSTTWVGWIFLLALPFTGAGMGGLIQDTARSITVEAVDRGWL